MRNILFDYDKAELRQDQQSQLSSNAKWLKQHPSVTLIVEGHADERGNQEYNLALGVRRANNVVQYLISQGVAESRIRTISYGKERPVCRDGQPNEACHQKNRRASFTETR
jgi:peptidoglycan-associated lipoprotein